MKVFITMAAILITQSVFATEYQLGVVLGSPTGISAKASLDNKHSIDAALAYSLADELGLEFHADYLVEKAHSFATNAGAPFELYYGVGARVVSITKGHHEDDIAIGPRVPIGLTYQLGEPRIEFFGELALAFDIIPATNLDLEGGVGLRFRF
ncbi:MAG: hypothetical protein PHY93_09995 [Bacteriovorax sp.]|nr:hypothetical protein [Bacteriovorax sp.]